MARSARVTVAGVHLTAMRIRLLTAAVSAAIVLRGCSGPSQAPGVPTLGGSQSVSAIAGGCFSSADLVSSGPATGGKSDDGYCPTCAGASGDARKNALHAAAGVKAAQ